MIENHYTDIIIFFIFFFFFFYPKAKYVDASIGLKVKISLLIVIFFFL